MGEKDTPQKAAMRDNLKNNEVGIKNGTDINAIVMIIRRCDFCR